MSSEMVKRCVVFGVDMTDKKGRDECVEFFVFDEGFAPIEVEADKRPENQSITYKINESLVAKPFSRLPHCHYYASYISVRGQVYRVGGDYLHCDKCFRSRGRRSNRFSRSTEFWDPKCNSTWIHVSKMKLARRQPDLHNLGSKIYVVGGYKVQTPYKADDPDFIFMEVLDVDGDRRWNALPLPPKKVKVDFNNFVSASVGDSILFGFEYSQSFYRFTPAAATWELLDHLIYDTDILTECTDLPAVVVGDHLLWLDHRKGTTLIGLHIREGKYFSLNLADEGILPSPNCRHYYPKFVEAFDELAVVWADKNQYLTASGEEDKGGALAQELGPTHQILESPTGFGSFHCSIFRIDFNKAVFQNPGYEISGCVRILSRRRCIGPNPLIHHLSTAFTAEVAVANISKLQRKRKEILQGDDEDWPKLKMIK